MLITGGAGFIGSELAFYLKDKYEILSVDNLSCGSLDNLKLTPLVKNYKIDITSDEFQGVIKDFKPNVVVHLAGMAALHACQSNPMKAFETNVMGTINVIESCKLFGVNKIIFSSTGAVYENCHQMPLEENNVYKKPDLHYATTKYHCEHIINNYVKLYNMDISIIRFFNVFGVNQDHTGKHSAFVPYIIKCILNNQTPEFFSDGNQKRDYIFSEDVADLIDKIIDHPNSKGGVYNACSQLSYSVNEIYKIFQKVFNFDKKPIYKDPKEFWDKHVDLFSGRYSLDKNRIAEEVNKTSIGSIKNTSKFLNGWKPRYSLEDGVKKIYYNLIDKK